jgi:hypothetical protein
MLGIARAVAFIWLGPYRGKMMRAGAGHQGSSNDYLISQIASPISLTIQNLSRAALGKDSSHSQPQLTLNAFN